MPQTTTWAINDMVHDSATGGVKAVYWECRVTDDTHTDCSASEGGKLRLEPDADSPDFVAYNDLTEETVLGWVYESLIKGDESAEDAKARIEANRQDMVTMQIQNKTAESTGVPW